MRLETKVSKTATVVAVEGDVVLDDAIELRSALMREIASCDGRNLLVDLERAPYVDNVGLAVLVEALQAARAGSTRLVLSGLHDEARGLLTMSHLAELFETYTSREEAEDALG